MSRIDKILNSFPIALRIKVEGLRDAHSCLMELDRSMICKLQRMALRANYLSGEGRRLDTKPHYNTVTDSRGREAVKETYFTFLIEPH